MGRRLVTGIQPSGTPHVGNYLGAIRPALARAGDHDACYFLADLHALTTVRDAGTLRRHTIEVAATWLALGLDPERSILYRQSDVPETGELAWILSCLTPKGFLNRAHKYKDAVAANERAGRAPDDGVSAGLFNYPVLMAADILLLEADVVPVGRDNAQHVEMARDIAEAFNRAYGSVLKIPELVMDEDVATIPGLDGRKMSSSYGNEIPIFAAPDKIERLVRRIVTDSRRPEEPKDPQGCNVFALWRHFASAEELAAMRGQYASGGLAYAEIKDDLARRLADAFAEPRRAYEELIAEPDLLESVLAAGARRARALAGPVLERVRGAVGL